MALEMLKAVKIPVTVKMRAGWNDGRFSWAEEDSSLKISH